MWDVGYPTRRDRGRSAWWAGLVAASVVLALLPLPADSATAADCRAGHVALTFDDGPSASHTPTLLDVLAKRKVVGTFFLIGSNVDARPAVTRRTAMEGHALANHTYRHEWLTRLSSSQIATTLDRTDRAIRNAGGSPMRLARPPYGATDARVRQAISAAGYAQILWTIDPRDWENGAAYIRTHVLSHLRDGSVVLLHDGVNNTPQMISALPGIIDGARDRGFCFVPLDAKGRLVTADGPSQPVAGGPYRDVAWTSTHASAISRLKDAGITQGCGDGNYCPGVAVTRAQMATFLQRALDLPASGDTGFRDVHPGSVHADGIAAVREAGITIGCTPDGGSFCPGDPVRRDQMASFLARAYQLPPGPPDVFRDVPPGSTHAVAVGSLYEAGITRSCTDDGRSYCPGMSVTRAQMASFLVRAQDHAALSAR